MAFNPAEYSQRLAELANRTVVADGSGVVYSFNDGVKRAYEVFGSVRAGGGKILFLGDSSSSGLSAMMASTYSQFAPTMSLNETVRLSAANDLAEFQQLYTRQVKLLVTPADLLIASSVTGTAPLLLNGVASALEVGCTLITLSGGAPDNPLFTAGALNFYVPSRSAGQIGIVHHIILQCIADGLNADK